MLAEVSGTSHNRQMVGWHQRRFDMHWLVKQLIQELQTKWKDFTFEMVLAVADDKDAVKFPHKCVESHVLPSVPADQLPIIGKGTAQWTKISYLAEEPGAAGAGVGCVEGKTGALGFETGAGFENCSSTE